MDKYYIEKVSKKNIDRAEFKKMMEYVREGDALYVESVNVKVKMLKSSNMKMHKYCKINF